MASRKAALLPALGAGFGLLARHPLSALVWAMVYLTLAALPVFLVIRAIGPGVFTDYIEWMRNLEHMQPGSPASMQLPESVMKLQRLQSLQILGTLLSISIVYTAIYRAILSPEKRGFAYLRLSWAELRTGALAVILYILFVVGIVAGVLLCAIPIGIVVGVSAAAGEPKGAVMALLGVLAAVVGIVMFFAVITVFLRLSMALPMSLAENRFRLFEAWKLTKGYGLKLLGMALVMVLVILVIEVIVLGVVAGAGFSIVGSGKLEELKAFMEHPDWKAAAPWLGLIGVIYLALITVILPVTIAPWARAYQLIAGQSEQPAGDMLA